MKKGRISKHELLGNPPLEGVLSTCRGGLKADACPSRSFGIPRGVNRGFLFFPFFLLAAALIGASCATTPPPDTSAPYRERLWAEIGSLPESIPELLHPENPTGPETRLYLKTYDLEPTEAPANSWYIRLGLLRERKRIGGQRAIGQGIAGPAESEQVISRKGRGEQAQIEQPRSGDLSYTENTEGTLKTWETNGRGAGNTSKTMDTSGGGDRSYAGGTIDLSSLRPAPVKTPPSLRANPLSDTLPPLGVLVGVPREGTADRSYRDNRFQDNKRKSTEKDHTGETLKGLQGTVFLVHGYLDHSGSWASVIKRILREGFVVVALDLPGHGFSGGNRGDIEHFSQYGEAVRRVVEWAGKISFPRPWIAIGHSTGAAALWMELVRQEEARYGLGKPVSAPFDNVLFLAPLVRSAHWRLSMTLVSLTSWAIPYWKSRTAEDPLFTIPYFPVRWAEKLKEWEGTVGEYPVLYQKGWILQGTDDDVVDHGYSVPFLRSKLPNFQVRYIEGAGHVPYLATLAGDRFVREVREVLRIPP